MGKGLVYEWLEQKKESERGRGLLQGDHHALPLHLRRVQPAARVRGGGVEDHLVAETAVEGGVPPQSNALEARNGAQKKALCHGGFSRKPTDPL